MSHLSDDQLSARLDASGAADASAADAADRHLAATLELIDKELSWVDDTNLSAGKEIEIGLKPTSQVGEPLVQSQVVFKGAIASLEPQYHVHGHPCVLVIRAYDKLHQLHRGTGTKTFQTAKDSEIVQKIVQEAGLSGQITATAVQNEHVFRGDLSAYEFVQLLGRRNGFVTYCDGTTVHWKPLKDMNFPALALHYDRLILDLAAGIDPTVMRLARGGDRVIVITTEEPTALTDAYAFIKVLRQHQPDAVPWVVINRAEKRLTGRKVYEQLAKACEVYLKFRPPLAGVITNDPRVPDSIRAQTPLPIRHPNSQAFEDCLAIVEALGTS